MNKILLCALIPACIAAVGLTAQNQDQEQEQTDIEVVVTASRVEEPAEEVPAYVSVITAEELSASGQTTLVEALEKLAGLHFRSFSGNAAQAEITMRGFGGNSHGRVLVLLDGRRLNRPDMASVNWLEIPIEAVERVEVVRGGSSVLYGDNAVAGVINIITKKGIEGFGFDVSAQYGSFNQNQERAKVEGLIGPVSVAANVEHSATDGFRERSAYRSLGGGLDLGLDLDRLSTSLILSYSRLYYELPGPLSKAEFDSDPNQAGNPSDESSNQYVNANLGVTYEAEEDLIIDGTLSYGLKLIQSDLPSNFTGKYSDLMIHSVGISPKLQMDLDILKGNRLIVGVDGYYDQLGINLFTDAERTATTDEYKIGRVDAGVYASDDLSILPVLALGGGVRYEFVHIDAQTLKTSGAVIDDASSSHSFVFDSSLLLRPIRNAKFWISYGTVFRIPFIDEIMDLYNFGLAAPFNTDLKPEKGYDIELGGEAELLGMLELAVNGFWLDMRDEIAYDSLAKLNVNLDETRHIGVETEVAVKPVSRLEVSADYTYTRATFRSGDNAGKRIPLVPEHRVDAEALCSLPLDIALGAGVRYVGDMYSGGDYDNDLARLDGYWLLNLFVRYSPRYVPGELELYFGVENVLDTIYASMGYDWGTEVVYYPGAGRSWKLGASYRY